MTDQVEARASYLHEAAHLLGISSPSASAFLGSAYNKLLQDAELEVPAKALDAHRREICGACGNLMIPGWSCEIKNKPPKGETTVRNQKVKCGGLPKASPSIVYCCSRCHRKTEQTLQSQPRRRVRKAKSLVVTQANTATSDATNEDEVKKPRGVNASSKQRQKARKGGLQAMLEKNKSQNSSQGLDLMDFAM
ncbi:hypothetical protein BDU57DRAFT_90407 [Ampelomyces quisqualis]|uniref:RNAse P Rpr2/Rpp21/SNM1 subunit domain-containing protein n=1 Tax=Ampelomyces quisqualis TaxID=50730 RepID=A0A6A5QAL9_AMPQU|nr:hypothetical protein BDU57DRAFT_90407 [Ampelomyces quisqualis]